MSRPPQRGGRSRAREPVARKQRPLTLGKLGVRNRTRAVLKAFELQLVWRPAFCGSGFSGELLLVATRWFAARG